MTSLFTRCSDWPACSASLTRLIHHGVLVWLLLNNTQLDSLIMILTVSHFCCNIFLGYLRHWIVHICVSRNWNRGALYEILPTPSWISSASQFADTKLTAPIEGYFRWVTIHHSSFSLKSESQVPIKISACNLITDIWSLQPSNAFMEFSQNTKESSFWNAAQWAPKVH